MWAFHLTGCVHGCTGGAVHTEESKDCRAQEGDCHFVLNGFWTDFFVYTSDICMVGYIYSGRYIFYCEILYFL